MCLRISAQQAQSAAKSTPTDTSASTQILSSYEGQNVASIEIAGRPDLSSSQFDSAFAQKPGQPFSKEKVEQTAAAVKTAGKFEDVRLQVDPEASGVRVLLIVEPAVYFGIFQFPGAAQFPYSRLIQIANFPIQTPFNATEVEYDRQSLLTFFRQEGFFQAEVRSEVKVDRDHAIADILFPTKLGRRSKFGTVDIAGLPTADQDRMKLRLKSLLAAPGEVL